MKYVDGKAVDKLCEGSKEQDILLIQNAIAEHFADSPVRHLATYNDYSVVVDKDGLFKKISYSTESGTVEDIKVRKLNVPRIEEEDIPAYVSENIKEAVDKMMNGEVPSRTRVRSLISLIEDDEDYWLTDILSKMDEEITDNAAWHKMYQANQEKIHTSLYGNLRDIQKDIPKTSYSKIAPSKRGEFEEELRESLEILRNSVKSIIDKYPIMVFDEEDEFFGAIQESLIAEAQAVYGLLGKAGKLMGSKDMDRMSVAHDRLAGRAKTMAIVSAYLKNRAQKNNEE